MSLTRILCEKCGVAQAWCKCPLPSASSAQAPVQIRGASPLVGTDAVVVCGLPSVEEYVRLLYEQASKYRSAAAEHVRAKNHGMANSCLRIAEAYDFSNTEFRALMARSELRQPTDNIASETRRGQALEQKDGQ